MTLSVLSLMIAKHFIAVSARAPSTLSSWYKPLQLNWGPYHDHTPPVLVSLHWHPLKFQIDFKILLFTFKALTYFTLKYLSNLLTLCVPPRLLRSTTGALLVIPRLQFVSKGDWAFAVTASALWNFLPPELTHSKSSTSAESLTTFHVSMVLTAKLQAHYLLW